MQLGPSWTNCNYFPFWLFIFGIIYCYKRPLDSYASPYQSRETRAKVKAFWNEEFQKLKLQKKIRETAYHSSSDWQMAIYEPHKPFSFFTAPAKRSHVSSWNQVMLKAKDPIVLERCRLSHSEQQIWRTLATFTGCPRRYFLLAPIY